MDPITAGALAKGAAKIGDYAINWAKGPTAHRVAAGLGARLDEGDFEIFNFKSLETDERYWDFIEEYQRSVTFDDARISEILWRHVARAGSGSQPADRLLFQADGVHDVLPKSLDQARTAECRSQNCLPSGPVDIGIIENVGQRPPTPVFAPDVGAYLCLAIRSWSEKEERRMRKR
jgi:hypothetical protein